MSEEKEQSGTSVPGNDSTAQDAQQSTEFQQRTTGQSDSQRERKRFDRRPHHDRRRPDGRGRHGGRRPPGRYRPTGKGGFERADDDVRLQEMIREAEQQLADSTKPVQLENLNSFERKQFHQYFERRKPAFETKTYRGEGDSQVLWIFPVANLKKFAEEKAKEALETGAEVVLPPMSNYERFLVHDALKEIENIEAISVGEGPERHIEIQPKKFGRGLKKIMKKIKLM
jgi:hypothetical protein